MLDIRPHEDAPPFMPFAADRADRRGAVEPEKNLDRMVRVGRHFPARLPDREEAAFPQVPARRTLPGGSRFIRVHEKRKAYTVVLAAHAPQRGAHADVR